MRLPQVKLGAAPPSRSPVSMPVASSAPRAPVGARPLSTRGYGDSFFTANDVAASVRRAAELLGGPPVANTLGTPDLWAVVDNVAARQTRTTSGRAACPKAEERSTHQG